MAPLPPAAALLLDDLDAPPRLRAHLRAVHDVAVSIVDWLAAVSGREPWEVFLDLDDHLTALADTADERLAFQNSHPIHG
ncbi:hypothetical protein JIG36_11905 [Actinoplanes sp. LDG1-06]|uniref:Uncharacterized protein n=1 Tax=Paractinoplanes ovalisporus TaxID=2810368 RepID=A0ABS2A8U6_9ACTN|nr:hypothetical protein [Actinoplanes ovalisporus]